MGGMRISRGGGGGEDLELPANAVAVFIFEASLHFLIFLDQRDELFHKGVVHVLPCARLRIIFIFGPVFDLVFFLFSFV